MKQNGKYSFTVQSSNQSPKTAYFFNIEGEMKTAIFLDDIRVPSDVFLYIKDKDYLSDNWIIVRSYNGFVDEINRYWEENKCLPDEISFDHDLSDIHCSKS